MTLHVYEDLDQRSEEWYAARCGLVTASAVGRLITPALKVASNDDSRRLTAALVAERITGQVDPTFVNADMWRGIEAEQFAREKYSEHYTEAIECGFMRRDEPKCSLGFSPDGVVGDDGLIEIKAPRAKEHLRTILADEVPAGYMAQLQAGLLVSGRQWIDYVSFYGGMPLYVKRVLRDPLWSKVIVAAVKHFEETAREMESAYRSAVKGLPMTERLDLEIVV
jgi:predicted phage-related endonuclease